MKILKSENGFTLLEALIAMVILSIGIFSLFSMQTTGIYGNAKAAAITNVSNATRDQIEKFLGTNFTHSNFDVGNHSINGVFPINTISWVVVDWSNDSVDNDNDTKTDEFDERGVKSVQLTIQYMDKGIIRNTSIQFLKTEIL
jgi:prepilin-type N-terminal cleavage/methylation domain-containing protein